TIVDPRNLTQDRQSSIDVAYVRLLGTVETTAHVGYKDYKYIGDFYYDPAILGQDKTLGRWWTADLKGVTSAGRHKLVFGAEYQRNLRQDQTNYDVQPYNLYLDDHRSSDVTGVFAQDDIALTQKLTLSAGLRYDGYSGYGGSTGSDNEMSPRLGLIYHLSEPTVAKLLYGTAFRPPNVYERFYSFPAVQVGNPELKPEKIQSTEAILETRLREATRLSFAVFHYRIKDLIDTGIDPVSGLEQFQNLSEARTDGASVEIEHNMAMGLRLRASYTYQNARDGEGDKLSNLPAHLAKLNVSLPLGWGLQAALESQYTSRRETALSNIPSYVLTNATVSTIKPWHGLDLALSVYNLADRNYYDPADLGGSRDLMQQDGRTWRLQATYRF
ncbi:MAG TPA: TonB-dependent receptor, partial [Burkholderiales bacterium]|nr:TonB-dependent receptor [Burkholderiales bacterium]